LNLNLNVHANVYTDSVCALFSIIETVKLNTLYSVPHAWRIAKFIIWFKTDNCDLRFHQQICMNILGNGFIVLMPHCKNFWKMHFALVIISLDKKSRKSNILASSDMIRLNNTSWTKLWLYAKCSWKISEIRGLVPFQKY